MDGLITTLPAILKVAGDSHEVVEATVIAAWRHAAGEGLREHAAPVRLYEKKLFVAVADATWQEQMKSLSGQLLFRLNAILGQPLVTFIELIIAPERLSTPSVTQAPRKAHDEFAEAAVSLELMKAASCIQDGDLRRVFLGAAISCLDRIEKSKITN